jgi:hypothetical protein
MVGAQKETVCKRKSKNVCVSDTQGKQIVWIRKLYDDGSGDVKRKL